MLRCLSHRLVGAPWLAACALAPFAALAQSAASVSSQTTTVAVDAPVSVRDFPPQSLRAVLVVGTAPDATLNDVAARLAPGVRIRGTNNLLILPGQASGQKLLVNYTLDGYDLIKDVWVLRPSEAERLWPQTREQAVTWTYDPISHTWTKP